jgi:hypothetical protein
MKGVCVYIYIYIYICVYIYIYMYIYCHDRGNEFGFGLVTLFIGHLQLVITIHSSAIASSHICSKQSFQSAFSSPVL